LAASGAPRGSGRFAQPDVARQHGERLWLLAVTPPMRCGRPGPRISCSLEAAVRSEADLIELLPPNTVAMSALPRRTDVVSVAGYVG
jgi:hypothetical protein